MCLSDAFAVSGGERRPLMNYVSGISVDGEKVVLTDMLGAKKTVTGTLNVLPRGRARALEAAHTLADVPHALRDLHEHDYNPL